jgi:NADPH2:quinone reductase
VRAVALETFGGPDVLSVMEFPDPVPAPGRALVAVVAATVNPTDTLLRGGQQAGLMTELSPPYIPGMEFAGHVHALGKGSTPFQIGQRVMGIVNPRRPEGGAQAELLSVPASSLLEVPTSLDLVEAATVPMNGLTALKVIEALALTAGDTLLVTGGAGALGGYVIELAKHRGLHVIADARDNDRTLLLRLGAGSVVSRGPDMVQGVRELVPDGVHGLVDAAVIGETARALVRDGGICVSVRGLQGAGDTRVRHRAVSVSQHTEDADALRELAKLTSDGVLTPRVARCLPMEQAAEGHRLVEAGGLRGRVVLTFAETDAKA